MTNPITDINEKRAKHAELLAQLDRQLTVERRFGIKAHEISKILLKPNGRSSSSRGPRPGITYSSVITMKNGDEISVVNVNIKKLLDEGVEQ